MAAGVELPALLQLIQDFWAMHQTDKQQMLSGYSKSAICYAHALTPFLLSRIEELTKGDSLEANIELVLNNARLAGAVSTALARME